MGHPIYHLEVDVERCSVEVRLNDFPVLSLAAPPGVPATFAPPINPWLVGELNIVDVTLHPVDEGGRATSFFDARFSGNVRRFEKGDVVAPGSGEVVTELAIPDELAEQVRDEGLELPLSFTHVFANDVVDFSDELGEAAPIADDAALTDYAMRLSELAQRGDADALLAEHEPKVRAWVRAYDEPYEAFAASLRDELAAFLAAGPKEPLERADVERVACCGGRLWALRRRSGAPLLRTEPDAEGARMQLPIYVALRDGRLRVAR